MRLVFFPEVDWKQGTALFFPSFFLPWSRKERTLAFSSFSSRKMEYYILLDELNPSFFFLPRRMLVVFSLFPPWTTCYFCPSLVPSPAVSGVLFYFLFPFFAVGAGRSFSPCQFEEKVVVESSPHIFSPRIVTGSCQHVGKPSSSFLFFF